MGRRLLLLVLVALCLTPLAWTGTVQALKLPPGAQQTNQPEQPALIVRAPTEVLGPLGEQLGMASPGERYVVLALDDGWALAYPEEDVPERPVWIAHDGRVDLVVRWTPPVLLPMRPTPVPAAASRWDSALEVQRATQDRLRVLGDAPSCELARLVSFRRSDVEPQVVDHWYMTSQLWADAALLPLPIDPGRGPVRETSHGLPLDPATETETQCQIDKGFGFLDRMWNYEVAGYYARSNPTGTAIEHGPRYADDNSLVGLALLAAAAVTPDDATRRRYVYAAERAADFLTGGGLWDDIFGGGFWWNTGRGDTPEGKPAQSNALAALFFGRLYQATGNEAHRVWALQTLQWLDATLFDPQVQLYRWSVAYQQPAVRAGEVRNNTYFNYDQGIALEAQILAYRLDGNVGHLDRARAIGRAIHPVFWQPERGGYNLEAGVDQVFTSYAAWVSLGHLALYDLDRDASWLALAQQNADALIAATHEADGGYAYRYFRCPAQTVPGCEGGPGAWALDRTRDTSAQAWMQHLQAALAAHFQNSASPT
jgi:hypothetical protein